MVAPTTATTTATTATTTTSAEPLVLQDLRRFLSHNGDSITPLSNQNEHKPTSSLFDKTAMAVPVAAISALLCVVQRSTSETMMGLQDELKQAADLMLQNFYAIDNSGRSYIALQSGCELFLKYITRTFLELPNFDACRQQILERGERFQTMSLAARDKIAQQAWPFLPDGATVLTHGWSRVVAHILERAVAAGRQFDVLILEGRPDAAGVKAANCYARESKIPVKVVLDSAMAYCMEQVDLVLVGAEGVLENGAVVNKLGTATLAACAKAAGKPFYVAAESYKFARLYPLHQSDLPQQPGIKTSAAAMKVHFVDTATANEMEGSDSTTSGMKAIKLDESIQVENPPVDLTHSKYISLLFTDLGVLTPSAVSDELIRLYQ